MKLAWGSVDYQIINPAVNPKVGTGSGLEILQLYLKNYTPLMCSSMVRVGKRFGFHSSLPLPKYDGGFMIFIKNAGFRRNVQL